MSLLAGLASVGQFNSGFQRAQRAVDDDAYRAKQRERQGILDQRQDEEYARTSEIKNDELKQHRDNMGLQQRIKGVLQANGGQMTPESMRGIQAEYGNAGDVGNMMKMKQLAQAQDAAEREGWYQAMGMAAAGDVEGANRLYASKGNDKQTRFGLDDQGVVTVNMQGRELRFTPDQIKAIENSRLTPEQRAKIMEHEANVNYKNANAEFIRGAKSEAALVMAKSRGAKSILSHALSIPQQRTNDEIDVARAALDGMTRDEVMRKTQSATATGRTNPEYDPQLAGQWKLANRRKYGEDSQFDAFARQRGATAHPQAGRPSISADLQKARAQNDISARFASDPAMKGHRTGKMTPDGVEVLDANGRIIGHYN